MATAELALTQAILPQSNYVPRAGHICTRALPREGETVRPAQVPLWVRPSVRAPLPLTLLAVFSTDHAALGYVQARFSPRVRHGHH